MYQSIPQELDFEQGSALITVGRHQEACSYWWRTHRLVADGRTFAVWVAAATGLEALLGQHRASREPVQRTYGLVDDRPTWWVREVTEPMMVEGSGAPGTAGRSVVAATPFELGADKLASAARQENELLRLAREAIVTYLNTGSEDTAR